MMFSQTQLALVLIAAAAVVIVFARKFRKAKKENTLGDNAPHRPKPRQPEERER